jgi:tRNA nucleotidyltransferase (CCA-adding enzyme)
MPDYIYLLENRLSSAQREAVQHIRQAAREAGLTVFLAGGAVRDLTSGFPVRDLDFSVQGNALKLKKTLEKSGAKLWGEHAPTQTLFYWFPGSVRVEISSTRREEYPKPGKPVYHWATMLEDLRRRDFTANAMAISLNEGSYGLLLDPLNGIADIEARHLRLVHNYGFLEDPSRMIRVVRLAARTGWQMDERTQIRYQNAKDEGVIGSLGSFLRGYELEEIGHEEDALKALKALEAEGWMEHLCPAWTSAKADLAGLEQLHQLYVQLLMQGVHPDLSAAQMQLLTAKLQPKDLAALKKELPRPGFVEQWNHLDEAAKEFAARLTGKEASLPSATWKLIANHQPEAVLWLAFTSKTGAVQSKFKNFFSVWPEARQKMPVQLMAEMRITSQLPEYNHLLNELFFALIDGRLESEEAMRAFLEPYSPPAPPPPVSIRRSRSRKAESKAKMEDEEEELDIVTPSGYDEDEDLGLDEDEGEEEHEEEEEEREVPVKAAPKPASGKTAATGKPAAIAKSVAVAPKKEEKPVVAKAAPAAVAAGKGKVVVETKKAQVAHVVAVPASKVPAPKAAPAKVVAVPAKTGKPAAKAVVKKAAPTKPVPKPTAKAAPAKAKPAGKKKH